MTRSNAVVLFIVVVGLGLGLLWPRIERALWVGSLFSGAEQYQSFARLTDFFSHSTMTAPAIRKFFEEDLWFDLPDSFEFEGESLDTREFLEDTDSAALLILSNGTIIYEEYWGTGGKDVKWISMSVAKSVIGTGVGFAVDDGLVDIESPIVHYVPELAGSAYELATVKDVLQMSSGARWSEDYSNSDSEIIRSTEILAYGGSINEFVASIPTEFEPGSRLRYNSMDTQALTFLISKATGKSVTQYLEEKLWHPLGMESEAHWLLDSEGVELGYFGLNATARDFAKIGELYRLKGEWDGVDVLSSEWIESATRAASEQFSPDPDQGRPFGYGYHWWLAAGEDNVFVATGVYHQAIYINPERDVVIVKLSADSNYANPDAPKHKQSREDVHMELFTTMVDVIISARETQSQ